MREATWVAMTWIAAPLLPLMMADYRGHWWQFALVGGIFAFFSVDAIRYGTRRRILIRVVVPLLLLSMSLTLYRLGIWSIFLTQMRSTSH
jgi:hypothetical protein